MKLKVQNRTGENLLLAIAQKMNPNSFETFFKTLDEVATVSNLSDTIGGVFNIDLSGIQISNKNLSVITDNESKNFDVLSPGKKTKILQ